MKRTPGHTGGVGGVHTYNHVTHGGRSCSSPRRVPGLPAAETCNQVAPLPRAISQPPGDRWVTLGHFLQGRGGAWFLRE